MQKLLLAAALPVLAALPLAAAADASPAPTAAQGRQLYTSFCARCHGMNMVTTGASFDLRSFPKDQRERFVRSVTQGLRAMPAWGTTLKPEELDALWLYVSSGDRP
jgi:cytochrome c55X